MFFLYIPTLPTHSTLFCKHFNIMYMGRKYHEKHGEQAWQLQLYQTPLAPFGQGNWYKTSVHAASANYANRHSYARCVHCKHKDGGQLEFMKYVASGRVISNLWWPKLGCQQHMKTTICMKNGLMRDWCYFPCTGRVLTEITYPREKLATTNPATVLARTASSMCNVLYQVKKWDTLLKLLPFPSTLTLLCAPADCEN